MAARVACRRRRQSCRVGDLRPSVTLWTLHISRPIYMCVCVIVLCNFVCKYIWDRPCDLRVIILHRTTMLKIRFRRYLRYSAVHHHHLNRHMLLHLLWVKSVLLSTNILKYFINENIHLAHYHQNESLINRMTLLWITLTLCLRGAQNQNKNMHISFIIYRMRQFIEMICVVSWSEDVRGSFQACVPPSW